MWLGTRCRRKAAVHLNITDANSSSGSAEQAENAMLIVYLKKKKSLKQICCGEKGSECGEPHRAHGTFSVFEIKKKKEKNPQKNQPRNSLKQLVCFIGVWGKGKKD